MADKDHNGLGDVDLEGLREAFQNAFQEYYGIPKMPTSDECYANYILESSDFPNTKQQYNLVYQQLMKMAEYKNGQMEEVLVKVLRFLKPILCGGEKIKLGEILHTDINWNEL